MVNVAEVAGEVIATLLIDVALAAPNVGVVKEGEVTLATSPVPDVDTHSGAVAPVLTCKTCPAVPIALKVVAPAPDWYGTEPARPPARLVAVVADVAVEALPLMLMDQVPVAFVPDVLGAPRVL